MILQATLQKVHNRGIPNRLFIEEMVNWAKTAPNEIFAPNSVEVEIFTRIKPALSNNGKWDSLLHRKAAMLEGMRCLSMFESSQKWTTGRDTTNPAEDSPDTISAGPFQISANSINLGSDLRALAESKGVVKQVRDGNLFQRLMKTDHLFTFEYAFRLVRHTVNHHGPLKRTEGDSIVPYLSRAAMEEFRSLVTA